MSALWDVTKLGEWWLHVTICHMMSVTAHEIFWYSPPLYIQVTSFAWLNAKLDKISTKEKFWKLRIFFFAQYYRYGKRDWEKFNLLLDSRLCLIYCIVLHVLYDSECQMNTVWTKHLDRGQTKKLLKRRSQTFEHSWQVRLAKQETLTPPGHLVSPLVCRVNECPPWCSIFGVTVTVHQFFCILHFCHTFSLCRVRLVTQFPARSSTQVLLCLFPGVLWLWQFLYTVGPHPVLASIYTLSLCRGHSWWVRLAKQETLNPPGHLVSPLVCMGPWMSTVVLYCWCHSDSYSVRLYFTLI